MLQPPTHAADAAAVFIFAGDPAIDIDQIEREKGDYAELGIDTDRHPWERYQAGETRFDLGAELELTIRAGDESGKARAETKTVRITDYIKPGSTPTSFMLRRLTRAEHRDTMALFVAKMPVQAHERAARLGVREIVNLGDPIKAGRGGLNDKTLDRLHDIHLNLISSLGAAVLSYCKALTDPESKPSG